jgi:hypothetical protein
MSLSLPGHLHKDLGEEGKHSALQNGWLTWDDVIFLNFNPVQCTFLTFSWCKFWHKTASFKLHLAEPSANTSMLAYFLLAKPSAQCSWWMIAMVVALDMLLDFPKVVHCKWLLHYLTWVLAL